MARAAVNAVRALAPVAIRQPGSEEASVASLAERAFVGSLFWLSGTEAQSAIAVVRDGDLCDPQLRVVMAACRALLADHDRADPALVTPLMVRAGWPSQLAGQANSLVAALVGEPLVPQGWRDYARTVMSSAACRRVVEAGARLVQAASSCQELEVLRDLVSREAAAALAELARADGSLL